MVSKRTKAYAGLELGWAQYLTQPNKHLLRSDLGPKTTLAADLTIAIMICFKSQG